MDSPLRKLVFVLSLVVGFVAVADGLAMLLGGPSSGLAGAALLVGGAAWLGFGIPRLLSPAGRPFSASTVARFGLLVVPVLGVLVAGIWWIVTPAALSVWFAVAWSSVWGVCVVLVAFLPCPECRRPYGRRGLRLETRSSECPHCGANPRSGASP